MNEDFVLDGEVLTRLSQRAGAADEGTLILLPVRIDKSGIGQYRDDQLTVPKELRLLEVPTVFLQEPDERTALSEYSSSVVLSILLGVAGNATYAVAKAAVRYLFAKVRHLGGDDSAQVSVNIARVSRADGSVIEKVAIVGPADTATAAEIIRGLTGSSADTERGDLLDP